MSDLHHVRLSGQRNQWGNALTGIDQSAVGIQLHLHVAALEAAQSQDDGVSPSVGQDGVLQVHGVDLPVRFDVPDQN